MAGPKNPFLTVPFGADQATIDKLRTQAKAEGRELVPALTPSHHRPIIESGVAGMASVPRGGPSFLHNLDAIAKGHATPRDTPPPPEPPKEAA